MKTLPAAPVGCLSRLCCQTTCQNPEPTFNDAASVTIVTGVIFLSLGSDLEEKYLSLFSFHTYHSLACCIGTCHSKRKPMSVSPQKQLAQPQASGRQKCTNPTCRHILLSRLQLGDHQWRVWQPRQLEAYEAFQATALRTHSEQKHLRVTEWVRLGRTTVAYLVPPPCSSRVILKYVTQDCSHTALEYLQWDRQDILLPRVVLPPRVLFQAAADALASSSQAQARLQGTLEVPHRLKSESLHKPKAVFSIVTCDTVGMHFQHEGLLLRQHRLP